MQWHHKMLYFSKITETARLPGTKFGTDKSQYDGYNHKPDTEI